MVILKVTRFIGLILWFFTVCTHCSSSDEAQYSYSVKRSGKPPEINAVWDKDMWGKIGSITLENYMGDLPDHFPPTKVKVCYDEEHVYVIFKVLDKYVKAVEKENHGKVWEDSCVEFFFTPNGDEAGDYFNLEVNCKGVFLFQYHTNNGKTSGFVSAEDCGKINISHSLERIVEEEIAEPLEWFVEYSIPVSILSNYMKVDKPGPGVTWRANFYKCADKTSHPHWLTWAPVEHPKPKFHLPEFFGKLTFE